MINQWVDNNVRYLVIRHKESLTYAITLGPPLPSVWSLLERPPGDLQDLFGLFGQTFFLVAFKIYVLEGF